MLTSDLFSPQNDAEKSRKVAIEASKALRNRVFGQVNAVIDLAARSGATRVAFGSSKNIPAALLDQVFVDLLLRGYSCWTDEVLEDDGSVFVRYWAGW